MLGTQFFFLPGCRGQLFAALDRPAPGVAPAGAVLHMPPFAEEMNRSRYLVATQARALAALGYYVLRVDPFGCGDSAGESADARWEVWREDALAAARWLGERAQAAPSLWALRFGALMAAELTGLLDGKPGKLVLWQPVLEGKLLLNAFLRVRVASQMLGGGAGNERLTIQALRACLAGGEPVDVGGYVLAPELAGAIDARVLGEDAPTGWEVHWLEVTQDPEAGPSPAAQAVVASWRAAGVMVHERLLRGPRFWTAAETLDCPELREETRAVFAGWLS